MNYLFLILVFGITTTVQAQGECLMSYTSNHYVLNSTSDTVTIWVDNKDQENFPTKGPKKYVIAPNERMKVSHLEWAEEFRDPTQWYVFEVKPEGLTRMCEPKNWHFEKLSKTQGEYNLTLIKTDDGRCVMDKNSLLSEKLPSPPEKEQQEDEILTFSNPEAEFPGGASALLKWMSENVRYPQKAIQDSISGKVYVQFVVEKNGELSNVVVLKTTHEIFNQEAIRLVKSMPNWIPGKVNGEAVRVRYNLPITFRLN